jgi:hypothetical protein
VLPPLTPAATEADRVERWRLLQLLEAGYPLELADRLALATYVDLHRAVALVRQTSPELAAAILL